MPSNSITLVIDSDLHFKADGIRFDKADHLAKLRQLSDIDAIICAGDLTNNGFDGKRFLCWPYGGSEDQLSPMAQHIDELQTIAPTYVSMGNHDNYVPWPYIHKGVRDYVVERHGGLRYSWEIKRADHAGTLMIFRFICLDLYPDSAGLRYLEAELKANPNKMIVLYFHYNVEGAWSDWWSDAEKKAFLEAIEPHRRRIKLIICGHRHANYHIVWNGYDVVSGAGSRLMVCTISKRNPADTAPIVDTVVRTREY